MKPIAKGVITSLVAVTLMMAGLQPASAMNGSTSGSGSPPPVGNTAQPPVNSAPPASSGADTGAINSIYYTYFTSANTWACSDSSNPDAIGSWASYERTAGYGSSQADGTTPPDNSGYWTFAGYYTSDGSSVWTKSSQLAAGCVYKPAFVKIFGGYCVVSSTATVEMTAPARKPLASNTSLTPWGAGDKSIAGCNASRTGSVSVDAATTEPGQYHAHGASQVDVLWLKHYVSPDLLGRTLPDEVLGYAPAPAQGVFDKVGTQNCSGWHENVVVPFDDATMCTDQNGGTGTIVCSVGSTPLVDIRRNADDREEMSNFGANPTFLMKDGIIRRIDFTGGKGAPTITGATVSGVSGQGTTFDFTNFPWRAGLATGANYTDFTLRGGYNQIASYDADKGTGKSVFMSGTHWDDTSVDFHDAAEPNAITTITPKWTFTADVTSSSIVINSIDPNAGTWVTTPTTTTNRENASCVGNTMKARVVRVVGDVVTDK